jgi:hypothetical protein
MLHAAAAAVTATLAIVGLPTCTDINGAGSVWSAFSNTVLQLNTSDGSVSTSIPFSPPWLRTPTTAMYCVNSELGSGLDDHGRFLFNAYRWHLGSGNGTVDYETIFVAYDTFDTLRFVQRFPRGARNTQSGNPDAVVSSFPGLRLTTTGTPLGYGHFSGFMAGDYPQYGPWDESNSSLGLSGGMDESGLITLFDANLKASVVISPASSFMSASLAVRGVNDTTWPSWIGSRLVEWGIMGNATEIPAGFESEWIMTAIAGGPTDAIGKWGKILRQRYNRPDEDETHDRDLTLRTLGFSTDNGAYYYYFTGQDANATYDDVVRRVKAYSVQERIPYRYLQLDSWWYYREDGADKFGVPLSGVTNWTALPSVFPDGGLPGVFAMTNWPVMAHNRYWATNNVYASNPLIPIGDTNYTGKTFEFAWGSAAGLPASEEFWDNLFTINANWGLSVYEQDWLSLTTSRMPQLTQNVTFGREWLMQMGRQAGLHGLTVQYCMSYPRHIFQALEIPAVTQARASNDYQPESTIFDWNQWRIGDSSLFLSALGLAPSKDSYWSQPVPQNDPHYDPFYVTYETRNRLESAVSSMSNGVVQISDRVGYTNRGLVMRACDADGRLLRPATAATPIDRYYAVNAFGSDAMPDGPVGAVHATYSTVMAGASHGYVLAATIARPFTLLPTDLPTPLRQDVTVSGFNQGWIAYEANTTDKLHYVSWASGNITIPPNDQHSFEYWTFAPAITGAPVVFLGEQDKWIAASKQRFPSVKLSSMRLMAEIIGAANETVNVAFADVSSGTPQRVIAHCVVSERLMATLTFDFGTMKATCA